MMPTPSEIISLASFTAAIAAFMLTVVRRK